MTDSPLDLDVRGLLNVDASWRCLIYRPSCAGGY